MYEIIQTLLDDPSFKTNNKILSQGQAHHDVYLIKKGL